MAQQEDLYLLKPSSTATMPALGGELNFDLQLEQAPASTNRVVEGDVFAPDGTTKLAGAVVVVLDSAFSPLVHAVTNTAGHYIFNQLAAGSYIITAQMEQYGVPTVQYFTLPDKGSLKLNITLSAAASGFFKTSLCGIVRDQQGNPIVKAMVTVQSKAEDGTESLFATTITDELGQYGCGSLPLGDYTIQVNATGYVLSNKLNVSVTEDPQYISNNHFTLSTDPAATVGTISGRIRSVAGMALINACVGLYVVEGTEETLNAMTLTQSDGLYVFTNVAPNKTYRVKSKVVNHF